MPIESQSIVPYNNSETSCYMCKEKLKVEKDCNLSHTEHVFNNSSGIKNSISAMPQSQSGQNGILNKVSDENYYFVSAKRIRISTRNKTT